MTKVRKHEGIHWIWRAVDCKKNLKKGTKVEIWTDSGPFFSCNWVAKINIYSSSVCLPLDEYVCLVFTLRPKCWAVTANAAHNTRINKYAAFALRTHKVQNASAPANYNQLHGVRVCVWVCAFDAISSRHFGSCSQLTDVPALISGYNLFSFQACALAVYVGGCGGRRCSCFFKQLQR